MQTTKIPQTDEPQNRKVAGLTISLLALLTAAGVLLAIITTGCTDEETDSPSSSSIALASVGEREQPSQTPTPQVQAPAESVSVKDTVELGEYTRPSKTPIPQIEDPAEMVSTVFWYVFVGTNLKGYSWSTEYLEGQSANFRLAGDATRKVTYEASRTLSPILNSGIVDKIGVVHERLTDGTDTVIVTVHWHDDVYGDEGVQSFLVVVKNAERGFWEIYRIDIYYR